MAEPTKLPDIDIGRKEPTGDDKKNTEAKRVAWNKDLHLEAQVTVIELKAPSNLKNAKEFADEFAKIKANELGKTVKVKIKKPKGDSGGGGSPSPRTPSMPASTTPRGTTVVDRDLSGILNYNRGMLQSVKGFIIHHTAGRGGAESTANTLNQRGLSIQYNIDRQGNITRLMPDGSRAAHIRDAPAVGLTNANTIGVEVSALNDADVLPIQVEAAKRLYGELAQNYPGIIGNVYGHGEINSHKQATEGKTIADAIRGGPSRPINPSQNIPPAPLGSRTLRDYMNLERDGGGGGGGGGGGSGSDEEVIESKEQKPDGRDDDINKRAVKKDEGDSEEAKKLRKPPSEKSKRGNKGFSSTVEGVLGIKSEDSEGTEQGSTTGDSFLRDQFNDFKGGIPREFTAQIPPMESLLMGLPQNSLGQFINQLPGPLQGLIPPGLVPGISGNNPVSLNGLMQLVGGGALGQAAGQILRLTNNGLGTPNIPINNPQIPNSNSSALANSLGTISRVATNRSASGIPVDLTTLTRSIQLVLRSSGNNVAIPTNILGISSQIASQALGSIINQALGGLLGGLNIPILPSNLSIPNSAIISGLSQFLPPGIAQNILSVGQITGLLPGNLQNQIPNVSPNVYNGGVPNSIEQNRLASPNVAPGSGYPGKDGAGQSGSSGDGGGGFNGKKEEGVKVQTENGRHIPYHMMISKYLTLDQVTRNVLINRGTHKLVPHMNYSVDELIENLSAVAKNCYDPLHEKFGPAHVNSGFRENSGTDHGRGMALDISFEGSHARLFEISKWAKDNLPFKQIILERKKSSWLHIAYDKSGAKAGRPVMTQLPPRQGENSRYINGLVNLYGNR